MTTRVPTIASLLVAVALSLTARAQGPAPAGASPARPDNFYAAGNRVEITTPKAGDVVVAGRRIEIAQSVGGDILAAGWSVALSAAADDDVRIAGGEVSVNAPVKGDLTVAGGDVSLGARTQVSGRSWVTGNAVRVDGVYERELQIAGAKVEIAGEIQKPLSVIADTLDVLPSARILAPLTYKSPREARIAQGAIVNGPVTFDRIQEREAREARTFRGLSTFLFSAHLFLAGVLVIVFLPQVKCATVRALREHPGKSVLTGFAFVVSIPVAVVLLMVSIVGLPFGFALAALYAVALFISVLITAFVIGDVEAKVFKAEPVMSRGQHVFVMLAGVLTLALLRSLLGSVVVLASALFGLGALVIAAYERYPRPASIAT